MGLLQQLRPEHKTMADLRKHNLKPLRQVCRQFTVLGKQLDLCAGTLVARDGSTWCPNQPSHDSKPTGVTARFFSTEETIALATSSGL